MTQQPDRQELELRQKHAHHVFTEMLTGISPECKDALVALYDLVRADQALYQCDGSTPA
ncbi:hypothetical protein IV102_14900 [bacterium]|nr:hypothetical protein [bacterium]